MKTKVDRVPDTTERVETDPRFALLVGSLDTYYQGRFLGKSFLSPPVERKPAHRGAFKRLKIART